MTWVWQIKLDEGAGSTAADTGPGSAVDLTITGGAWSSIAAGDGHSGVLTRSAFGAGNKIYDESNTSTTWTWEVVVNAGTLPEGLNIVIWFYDTTDIEHSLSLLIESDMSINALCENQVSGGSCQARTAASTLSTSTVYVLHLVYDQGNATEADRLRIYRNGSRIATPTYTAPTSGLDPGGPGTQAQLTCNSSFGDAAGGTVYWFAAADHAATDGECSTRATALLSDNDADPSGGGGGGGAVATPDHISTLSFPALCRKPGRDDRWTRGGREAA